MKITRIIKISIVTNLALLAITMFFFWRVEHTIKQSNSERDTIAIVMQKALDLTGLTYRYAYHPEAFSDTEWFDIQSSILALVDQHQHTSYAFKPQWKIVYNQTTELGAKFNRFLLWRNLAKIGDPNDLTASTNRLLAKKQLLNIAADSHTLVNKIAAVSNAIMGSDSATYDTSMYTVMVLLTTGCILLILFAIWFKKYVTTPLEGLITDVAKYPSSAPTTEMIVPAPGHSEVTDLAHSFNEMLARLNQTYANLRIENEHRARAEERAQDALQKEQNLRVEAENLSRLKDEFLITLSHELRTPLNAVMGWTDLILSGELNQEQQLAGLEVIKRSARTELMLINDLLDVSRIVAGKLHFTIAKANLTTIIHEALQGVRLSAEAKNISLIFNDYPDNLVVLADDTRLQQAIWNLLTNAIKFTNNQSKTIEIVLTRQDDKAIISVIDHGIGIDANFLPYVFDRFRQADGSTSRSFSGLGIGLAIVKHVVEAHGGQIAAQSAGIGKGSTFTIALPLFEQHSLPSSLAERKEIKALTCHPFKSFSTARGLLEGIKILVLDDDIGVCQMLEMLLHECGAIVKMTCNVKRAIAEFTDFSPNLVLCDIGMPVENGFCFLSAIKALPGHRNLLVPIIALTAYNSEHDRRTVLEAGFAEYLTKPVDTEKLLATIIHFARRRAG